MNDRLIAHYRIMEEIGRGGLTARPEDLSHDRPNRLPLQNNSRTRPWLDLSARPNG